VEKFICEVTKTVKAKSDEPNTSNGTCLAKMKWNKVVWGEYIQASYDR